MYAPVVLAVVVVGTLVATCFRVLSLQSSLSNSKAATTKNEISATLTTGTVTGDNSTAGLSPTPTHSLFGTQKQSTASNASQSHCTPPFTTSSSSGSSFPKPRHIFIDFGANNGLSVSSFIWGTSNDFRNKLNPEERALVDVSLNVTGSNVTNDWEAHVLEANPVYTESLIAQQQEFDSKKTTRSYTLYQSTAITTYDGIVQLILDNNKTGAEGSTTLSDSRSAVGKRINVTAIDILTFFRKLRIRPTDHVIVKMDVEGAEYAIVQRMITHCIFPLIDKIAIGTNPPYYMPTYTSNLYYIPFHLT